MLEFTPQAVHDADQALYFAGMIHAYAFTKCAEKLKTPDNERELEGHRGASFFFAVAGFIRVFGRIPNGKEESEAVDKFLTDIGVTPRWRPYGRGSFRGEAEPESSGPSEA